MLSKSPLHHPTCGVCAQVREACAESCEKIPGMEECAAHCRRCAQSCCQMAQMAGA